MCVLDVFFLVVSKKTCYGSKIAQNVKLDECMKKQWYCLQCVQY